MCINLTMPFEGSLMCSNVELSLAHVHVLCMRLGGCVQGKVLDGGVRYSVCVSRKTLWLKLVKKLNAVSNTYFNYLYLQTYPVVFSCEDKIKYIIYSVYSNNYIHLLILLVM